MNVKEIITNEIIKKLEAGVIPWMRPWSGGECVNYVTQEPYKGINRMLLDGGEYLTFNQVKSLGGKIKKECHSHIVIFYTPYEKEDETSGEKKILPCLKYYRVFSLADVEGLESRQDTVLKPNFKIDDCDKLVNDYTANNKIKLQNEQLSGRAYYSPDDDQIVLPMLEQFKSSEHYYATAFHEMAHSTGHRSRLNRLDRSARFGSQNYAKEELVAELTSAMLCKNYGIDSAELLDNTASYIDGWMRAIRKDTNLVISAAAKAEKAYEYITNS